MFYKFGSIVGASGVMQKLYGDIIDAANSNAAVLITGESGTGKELVAREIHMNSRNAGGPFVCVNCGAIPENLIESEFFGHKKGAFTGAVDNHSGFIEQAENGTLFLDEVGEISQTMQVKLLRILDSYTFFPLGSNKQLKPRVRFICATNKNLESLMNDGVIRSDFYYRINVINIHIEPLRNRKEDIPNIIDNFLETLDVKFSSINIPSETMQDLMAHDWRGNVRELQNAVKRYVATGNFNIKPSNKTTLPKISLEDETAQLEIKLIRLYMEKYNYKTKDAASALSINLRTLQRKIKEYNLKF